MVRKQESRAPVAKRLYRSRHERLFGGVCGGIAEHFDLDPIWVRLAAVLLAFLNGAGILIYIVAWVLIPLNPHQKGVPKPSEKRDGVLFLGVLFIAIGLLYLFRQWLDLVWPLAIIAIGIFLLAGRRT